MVETISEEKIEIKNPEFKEINEVGGKIYSKIKQLNLNKAIKVVISTDYYDNSQLNLGIEGEVKIEMKKEFEELTSYLADIAKTNKTVTVSNQAKLFDPQFPKINSLRRLESDEPCEYEHKKGEVLLVDFWATWCGPCQKPMAHNQEMLEHNEEKWKGKAKIVGVAVSDKFDTVKERVESKNWKRVEHYISSNENVWSEFDFNGIPCVFLIDKEGFIQYKGHPMSIDLEGAINLLIEGKSIEDLKNKNQKQSKKDDEKSEEPKKILTTIEERLKSIEETKVFQAEFKQTTEKFERFAITHIAEKVFDDDNFNKDILEAKIMIYVREINEDTSNLSKFNISLKEFEERLKKFNVNIEKTLLFRKLSNIDKIGKQCCKCKSILKPEDKKFVCYTCMKNCAPTNDEEGYTYCFNCVPDGMTEEAKAPFHEHVLFYIPQENKEALTHLYNLVSECTYYKDEVNKDIGGVSCDNCAKGLDNIRWSCSCCYQRVRGSYDLCDECFKLSQDPNLKLEEFKTNSEHDVKTHVLARINYFFDAYKGDFTPFEK